MNTPLKPRIARRSLPCALIMAVLAWSEFLPAARAALDPPPDGGYPGNNTAEGERALLNLGGGASANTGVGFATLYNNSGNSNTAVGCQALTSNTNGTDNTAVGSTAGAYINGTENTAIGSNALLGGTINAGASYNTAIGFQSLYSITTGYGNVANGWNALHSNRTGIYNTATGAEALYNNDPNGNNVTDFNTATGGRALYTNVRGTSNTGTGYLALYYNRSGSYNTAEGISALSNNTTGSNNVAIGRDAGANLTTGSNISSLVLTCWAKPVTPTRLPSVNKEPKPRLTSRVSRAKPQRAPARLPFLSITQASSAPSNHQLALRMTLRRGTRRAKHSSNWSLSPSDIRKCWILMA